MTLYQLAARVIDALEEESIPYMVVGALSSSVFGVPRATKDMDVVLFDLYRTLDDVGTNPLRDAHAQLDAAVRAAYPMPKDADILAFLLALNQSCAAKEAAGETITPPGLPLPEEERGEFVTEDRICVEL